MLRIIQNRSSTSAKSYYAHSDYLSEGQELTGHWGGKGAKMLGLRGEVAKQHFDRLCDNLHPITGDRLTLRTDADRTVGYDFNFHLPKGVSLAYTLGRDDRILDVFRKTVDQTMQEIELEAKTRVRKHGADENRLTQNLTWASFVHTTARPILGVPDPHVHAHAFVFNNTWDEKENAWKAGQFRDLKRDAPYFEAAFHARMALGMRSLGYDIRREGKAWDIDSIPKEINKRFSRRTDQIEQLAQKLEIKNPRIKAELAAKTRESKESGMKMSELRDRWSERLTPQEQWLIRDQFEHKATRVVEPEVAHEQDSMQWGKLHSFERHSVVPDKQLLAESLRHGVGQVSVEGIKRQLSEQKVIVRTVDGRALATTPEMLREERDMMLFAKSGRSSMSPINKAWNIKRGWLNAEQQDAVKHVLESPDRVMMIRGGAGTGKTALMQEAVEGMEATGTKVFTFAPSADASRGVLASEGFQATTVAELLESQSLQGDVAGGVIWIDEAGLLGTRTLKQVFDVAERTNARVVLSGDWKQHGSVEAGAAMRILELEAGIQPAMVSRIQRQSGDYKEAVALLAEGKTGEGLESLRRLGWVKEIADDDERNKLLARDMVDAMMRGEESLALSPTHAEGDQLSEQIRSELKARSVIRGEERFFEQLHPLRLTEAEKQQKDAVEQGDVMVYHRRGKAHKPGDRVEIKEGVPKNIKRTAKHFEVYTRQGIAIAEGDTIRITGNGKTKSGKHPLYNGSRFQVRGFTADGDILVRDGWVIPKDYGFIAPGYVVTSHASQGRTVDRVFIAESTASLRAASKEQFYVSVSRGRGSATIYTNDYGGLSDAIGKSDPRISATELVRHRRNELVRKHQKVAEARNRENEQRQNLVMEPTRG